MDTIMIIFILLIVVALGFFLFTRSKGMSMLQTITHVKYTIFPVKFEPHVVPIPTDFEIQKAVSTNVAHSAEVIIQPVMFAVPEIPKGLNDILEAGWESNKLGEGAFGAVYKGKRKSNGLEVAVKVQKLINDKYGNVEQKRHNLETYEIPAYKLAAECGNVVKLHEHFFNKDTTTMYLIMDLINGKDFDHYITDFVEKTKSMSGGNTLANYHTVIKQRWTELKFFEEVINPLIIGLRCIHSKNLTHKDIKPANIMFDGKKPTIVDLGLACLPENCILNSGTPLFLSPEILKKAIKKDDKDGLQSSDIWALGASIFVIITSREELVYKLALGEHHLTEILASIPKDWYNVQYLLAHLLETDPEPRLVSWNQYTKDTIGVNERFSKRAIEYMKLEQAMARLPVPNTN